MGKRTPGNGDPAPFKSYKTILESDGLNATPIRYGSSPSGKDRKKASGKKYWIVAAALIVVAGSIVSLVPHKPQSAKEPAVYTAPKKTREPVPTAAPVARNTPAAHPRLRMDADAQLRGVYGMKLRLAETRAKLKLSKEDQERLLTDVVDFERRRAELEQSLVTVESFDGRQLHLTIPAYPGQGLALKEALEAQIGLDFPPDVAGSINAGLDDKMEDLFSGFGKFSQTMTLTASDKPGGMVRIVFAAGISTPLSAASDDTLAELELLSGTGYFNSGGVNPYWEAISSTVNSYFPATTSKTAR